MQYRIKEMSQAQRQQLIKVLSSTSSAVVVELIDETPVLLFHNENWRRQRDEELEEFLTKHTKMRTVCCHMSIMSELVKERALDPSFVNNQCIKVQWDGADLLDIDTTDILSMCPNEPSDQEVAEQAIKSYDWCIEKLEEWPALSEIDRHFYIEQINDAFYNWGDLWGPYHCLTLNQLLTEVAETYK